MESNERYRVEGLVVGRRRDGKRRYSESGKQALIGLCQQPGASVAAIAVANGLNPNVVRRWLSLAQAGRTFENERAATLLPVMLAAQEPDAEALSTSGPQRTNDAKVARGGGVSHRVFRCDRALHRTARCRDAEADHSRLGRTMILPGLWRDNLDEKRATI